MPSKQADVSFTLRLSSSLQVYTVTNLLPASTDPEQ